MLPRVLKRAGRTGRAARGRWLVAIVGLLVMGFCGVSAAMLIELRRDTWKQAVTGADNLLAAMSRDITRKIGAYDLSLQAVVDGLAQPELRDLRPELQQMLLFDRATTAKYLGSILVLDEHGDIVHDSGSLPPRQDNFSDREYFRAQRDRADAGLHISAPYTRRTTGTDDVIALSRRLERADGSFAGVVVGTMKLEFFRDLFASAQLGPHASINLFRTDGTLIMRAPYDAAQVGRDLSASPNFQRFMRSRSGLFTAEATLDGVRRIYSFTRLGDLPFVLNIALAEDDVFAAWRSRATVIGLVLLLLCGTASGLGFWLERELRRRARAERIMRLSEKQYRLLADHATDVILRLDHELRRTYVSPASLPVLGYAPEALLEGHPRDLIHPDDWPRVAELLARAQAELGNADVTYRSRHADGHHVWLEGRFSCVAEDGGFIVVLRDVSERESAKAALEAANVELSLLATSDGLTGLANRRRFDEVLAGEWRRAAREQVPLSLLLLDVDRFKQFNDTYGHQAGDRCLRAVADAVQECSRRPGDLVARYGGEEIAVILPSTDETGAAWIAERVRAAVEALGLRHEGNPEQNGVVTVSIGCSTTYPVPSGTAEDPGLAVMEADRALYEAKRTGRNRVVTPSTMPTSPVPPSIADEDARLAALAAFEATGAAEPSEKLDRVARLAATLLDVPSAFVSLVGRDEQVIAGRHGIDLERSARDDSFCAHTISGDQPFVVPDAAADPRFAENPLVTGGPRIRFYAGAPLLDPGTGQPLGALCIIDEVARPAPGAAQRALLQNLAALAANEMEERRREANQPAP